MATFQLSGATFDAQAASTTAPLVVLFERDDAIAVPLLSQLRLAGYDVRAARTPVELFDILGKHLVSLVLVDLGGATAGRREFWVALDGQRRGRAMQVMTFRYMTPNGLLDMDFESSARAIADVDIHGAHEFQLVIDGVRQRIPLHGTTSGVNVSQGVGGMAATMAPLQGAAFPGVLPEGIAPIGAALGVPSPYMQPTGPGAIGQPEGAYGYSLEHHPGYTGNAPMPGFAVPVSGVAQSAFPYAQPGFVLPNAQPGDFGAPVHASAFGQPGFAPLADSSGMANSSPSPFAHSMEANPFAAMESEAASPFAQPYAMNPFADAAAESAPSGHIVSHPFTAPEMPMGGKIGGAYGGTPPNAGFASSDHSLYAPYMRDQGGFTSTHQDAGASAARAGFASFGVSDASAPAQQNFERKSLGWDGIGERHGAMDGRGGPIADVWIPPDDDAFDPNGQTGVTPEISYHPEPFGAASRWGSEERTARDEWRHDEPVRPNSAAWEPRDESFSREETARIPAQTQMAITRTAAPGEQALGSVLVEGALLTPHKLEVLQGVQQMLSDVEVELKLGELALLFKFLSPDQLLAALLVSRGLVSPQQIAGLGRVKQELAGSGMDYDLETLLVMFHILPAEQLHQLRAELA